MTRHLVIADVHANATALEAVLAAEPDRDAVVFLGDAVDNGPRPNDACERLRELDPVAGVEGNHDRSVLAVGDGTAPDDDPFRWWKEWTYGRLSGSSRTFLESLDRTAAVRLGGQVLRLHHGDFPPPEDHDGPWRTRATPAEHRSLFETVAGRYPEDVVLLGHSHFPYDTTVAGTRFVNPGSVGLQRPGWPADRAHYATVEDGTVDLRDVVYDVDTVKRDARAVDSPFQDIWDWSPPAERSA